jgi:hypothetical protein
MKVVIAPDKFQYRLGRGRKQQAQGKAHGKKKMAGFLGAAPAAEKC